jgi:hypothetical protein
MLDDILCGFMGTRCSKARLWRNKVGGIMFVLHDSLNEFKGNEYWDTINQAVWPSALVGIRLVFFFSVWISNLRAVNRRR